jgi:hypothetical protein
LKERRKEDKKCVNRKKEGKRIRGVWKWMERIKEDKRCVKMEGKRERG